MTLQDYVNLTQTSIENFFNSLGSALSEIIAAIVILAVGVIVGYVLKRILVEILKAVNFEQALSSWAGYQELTKSHKGLDITTYVGELLRWVTIIVFIVPAAQALGLLGAADVVNSIVGYVDTVLLASLYLLIGFVVAWFIHRVIQAVAMTVGNNPSHLIANLSYVAIVIFASIQALIVLGLNLEIIRWIVIATLLAAVLAVGLGGRDQAMDLLKKLADKSKE